MKFDQSVGRAWVAGLSRFLLLRFSVQFPRALAFSVSTCQSGNVVGLVGGLTNDA